MSLSGIVEDTFTCLKRISSVLEQELLAERDSYRVTRLGQLIRDIDRILPLSARGLFRKVSGLYVVIQVPDYEPKYYNNQI